MKNKTFVKVQFCVNDLIETAGIILESSDKRLNPINVSELSRTFPYSEAPKMKRLYVSKAFDSWEAAFQHKRGEK